MHEASYYAYEVNDSGRSAQYRPKSFIMTDIDVYAVFNGVGE